MTFQYIDFDLSALSQARRPLDYLNQNIPTGFRGLISLKPSTEAEYFDLVIKCHTAAIRIFENVNIRITPQCFVQPTSFIEEVIHQKKMGLIEVKDKIIAEIIKLDKAPAGEERIDIDARLLGLEEQNQNHLLVFAFDIRIPCFVRKNNPGLELQESVL